MLLKRQINLTTNSTAEKMTHTNLTQQAISEHPVKSAPSPSRELQLIISNCSNLLKELAKEPQAFERILNFRELRKKAMTQLIWAASIEHWIGEVIRTTDPSVNHHYGLSELLRSVNYLYLYLNRKFYTLINLEEASILGIHT